MRAIVLLTIWGVSAACVARSEDAPKLDGTWQLAAGEVDGKPLGEEKLKGSELVLAGKRYTVSLAGRGKVTGVQVLGASGDRKTIDITDDSGPNKGKTCLGIYELKGDRYRVAFAAPGKPRPTSFASEPGSGQWAHVWKRVK